MTCDHVTCKQTPPPGYVPSKTPKFGKDKKESAKKQDSGNGKIRCPHCAWQPRKSDQWMCHCGCQFHTFDTAGKCPNCGWCWTQTQCQRCSQWAPHLAWYEDPALN